MNEQEQIRYNKELCEKYPFLMPRNRWTGKVSEDYDYTWTELDAMPEGWRIAFGDKMLEELKEALGSYINDYRIAQIKEKYGSLRWYDFGVTEESHKVILKYEYLSEVTCINCGKPATKISMGWISPYCDDCFNNEYTENANYVSVIDGKPQHIEEDDIVEVINNEEGHLGRVGKIIKFHPKAFVEIELTDGEGGFIIAKRNSLKLIEVG